MKLPQINLPKVSPGIQLGVAGVMFLLLIASTVMKLSEFHWNGNPIVWMQAKELVDEGKTKRANYKLEDAYRFFKKAALLYPNDAQFQFLLGEVCQRQRKWDEAVSALEAATKLDQSNADAWMHLSEVYSIRREPDKALSAAKQATSREPLSAEAQMQLAFLLQLSGKQAEADKAFKSTRDLDRSSARYWYLAGRYFHAQFKDQETEAAFRQAAESDRTEPEYAEWLGMCLYSEGKLEPAQAWMKRATEIDQDNATYWQNLATCSSRLNDKAQAEQAWEQAYKLNSDSTNNALHWADILVQNRRPAEAGQIYSKLIKPQSGDAMWNNYIHCLVATRNFDGAEKAMREYLQIGDNTRKPQTWAFLAEVLHQGKHEDRAREAYKQALALNPNIRLKQFLEKRLAEGGSENPAGHSTTDNKASEVTQTRDSK